MDKNNLLINLNKICFSYAGSPPVLDGLDFRFYRGDRLGLMGPNGSGKTTLFHIIMGLLKPSSGTIEIFGRPIMGEKDYGRIRQKIGLLFQDADDQLFSPTVMEDVAFGPLNAGKSREESIGISLNVLERLGLSGFEERITYKLSGGEKRLVSLATVLAMEPEILILDEPTTGLDDKTKKKDHRRALRSGSILHHDITRDRFPGRNNILYIHHGKRKDTYGRGTACTHAFSCASSWNRSS